MVLATRTSAPTTSLAVIRPKPRPDSPTASEISVIMLKSELPHEAPNPVSKKEARVHIAARRCGSLAARGARAAADAGDRHPSHADTGVGGCTADGHSSWIARGRFRRRPKRGDRAALRRRSKGPPADAGG